MPHIPPEERTVFIQPGQRVVEKSGEKLRIIVMLPRCIVDAHSHIENGACAPLPLLWEQVPLKPHLERKTLNLLAKVIKHSASKIQIKSTAQIGNHAAQEMDRAFGPRSVIGSSDFYKSADLFSFTVIQMMDMEYAWLGGFDGLTIYFETESPWYYYERKNAHDPKEKWKKVSLPGENQKTFSNWKEQYLQTVEAIKLNPLRLFGMYHYEPRRWNYARSVKLENNLKKGPWNYPFDEIVSATGNGLFLGFKMYPPLGYKPLDPRLPFLHDASRDGDCFYARCAREGIPILAHCSPGGMWTHDLELYLECDGASSTPATDEPMPKETGKRLFTPEGYFWTSYVHPGAWREVLVRFPELRLCLAHFGGKEWKRGLDSDWITGIISLTKEFDNVYTDFSCWDIGDARETFVRVLSHKQHAHLKKKILFGTDWYMTLLVLNGTSYGKYCEEFWEFFSGIPDGMDLWERFTFVNPLTFYGVFDKATGGKGDKLESLLSALMKMKCNKKTLDDNYQSLRRVQKYYEKIRGN